MKKTLLERGMESMSNLKNHKGTKSDLRLVLRLLSDKDAIRTAYGRTMGSSMEAKYFQEELVDDLADFLMPIISHYDESFSESEPVSKTNEFIVNYESTVTDEVPESEPNPYLIMCGEFCSLEPNSSDICKNCKYFSSCEAANKQN